jgi:hypothetical protein
MPVRCGIAHFGATPGSAPTGGYANLPREGLDHVRGYWLVGGAKTRWRSRNAWTVATTMNASHK